MLPKELIETCLTRTDPTALRTLLLNKDPNGDTTLHSILKDTGGTFATADPFTESFVLAATRHAQLQPLDLLTVNNRGISIAHMAVEHRVLSYFPAELMTEEILLGSIPPNKVPLILALAVHEQDLLKLPPHILGQPRVYDWLVENSGLNDRQLGRILKAYEPIGIEKAKQTIETARQQFRKPKDTIADGHCK